jgi:hypothetical protein
MENKFNHPIVLVDTFLLEWPWAKSVPLHLLILFLNVETLHYLVLSLSLSLSLPFSVENTGRKTRGAVIRNCKQPLAEILLLKDVCQERFLICLSGTLLVMSVRNAVERIQQFIRYLGQLVSNNCC